MPTHTLDLAVAGSGISLTRQLSFTETGVTLIDGEQVATAETDYEIIVALDFSACSLFYLVSDQDVTFETNSGAAPDDTIALLAGEPYIWYSGSYSAFLITADITSIFITNASGSTATIYLVALSDATP